LSDLNVVFVRTDGIGDLVLTLPAAAALKSHLTGARLSYLVSRYAAPILEHHPDIDDVLCDPGPDRPDIRRQLFARGFDAVVFFKPYLNWFWAAYRAGIRRRIGTGYRWYSLLLSDRVYEHRSRFDKHESQYNLNLLNPLGVESDNVKPPRLYLTPSEIKQADDLLSSLPRPRVIVHPGNVYARNWPTHRYIESVTALRALGFSVILTGSKREGEVFKDTGRGTDLGSSGALDLMGLLDLRQLTAVISRCDLVISGSTGPMHVAAALEVATLSLFDPRRASSPVRWGPPSERGKVLMPEVPTCEKCVYERCPYWDCMDRIPVGTVVQEARKILSQCGAGVAKV
jgi:ADP-heptose:LPS heptosyltransferase